MKIQLLNSALFNDLMPRARFIERRKRSIGRAILLRSERTAAIIVVVALLLWDMTPRSASVKHFNGHGELSNSVARANICEYFHSQSDLHAQQLIMLSDGFNNPTRPNLSQLIISTQFENCSSHIKINIIILRVRGSFSSKNDEFLFGKKNLLFENLYYF